jgi:methylmalonyl-CoA mutase N-terminal domain/subunit
MTRRSDSGIELKAGYRLEDVPKDPELQSEPGCYPFVRGITSGMYRDELWHHDLYAGFGNVETAKARYEELLREGASGINIALDLPTQCGLDSDDVEAAGEVGRVGLAVDTLADLEDLFDGVDLRLAKTIFTVGNAIGPIALAWFTQAAQKQGLEASEYVVHLQNDPLKEYTGRGTFIFPIEPSVRLACDVLEYVAEKRLYHWKPIGICGSQFRWAGSTAYEEIGLGIASAIAYVERLTGRGVPVDAFGPLLEMHLTADQDIFEEAAKFRAARKLWAHVMRERFGAEDPRSLQLRISLYTAGYRLTAQEPLNNAVRVAYQALAAALGGVQHIGTLSIDEALGTPSAEAARLALRTQQILAYETGVASVVDPLGGSYYVEALTEDLYERAAAVIASIDEEGGMVAAIRNGSVQDRIDSASYRYQQAIDSGERVVVGVNRFAAEGKQQQTLKVFRPNPEVERRQIERLGHVRARRSGSAVERKLDELRRAARDERNLVGPTMDAVAVYASVGEICGALSDVFGSWRDETSIRL